MEPDGRAVLDSAGDETNPSGNDLFRPRKLQRIQAIPNRQPSRINDDSTQIERIDRPQIDTQSKNESVTGLASGSGATSPRDRWRAIMMPARLRISRDLWLIAQ